MLSTPGTEEVDGVERRLPALFRRRLVDLVALALLLGAFLSVNDIGTWIGAPYWLDETWVALSTRASLADLPFITASTPIGWSLLLRLIPDLDALRLLPMAFAVGGVVAAYALGRSVVRDRAGSVLTGLCCAAAVLLLPAQQLRHDLKQYTADAAVTLALLAGAAWLDRTWTRRRLIVLAVAAPVGVLVSQATIVGALALFGALVVVAALRRQWRRVIEAAIAGAASGAVLGLVYVVLIVPNRPPALQNFWSPYFPTVAELPGYLAAHLQTLAPSLGFGTAVVPLLLVAVGLAVLAVWRRLVTMGTVLVLVILAVGLSVGRLFPLLDARTSYFLLVAGAAVAGIGVAGSAIGLARLVARWRASHGRIGQRWRIAVAASLSTVAFGLFTFANLAWYRFDGLDPRVPEYSPIAVSDVRTAIRWIEEHRRPGDVIVISQKARYGYVLYHDTGPLAWRATDDTTGWVPVVAPDPNVIVNDLPTPELIDDAVRRAAAQARRNGAGSRVLLLRTWWYNEQPRWAQALAGYAVSYPYGGTEPVGVIDHP